MNDVRESFDIKKLKDEFNLTDDAILTSGLTPELLKDIFDDYQARFDNLLKLKNSFLSDYILPAQDKKDVRIHSFSGRVKSPYHVIEKLIRKCNTNASKYRGISASNYYKYLTDLIGIRILLVYKEDWRAVHDYLLELFKDDERYHLKKESYIRSYDHDTQERYFVEHPKAYIRLGDSDDYPGLSVENDGYYRSLHYIPRYGEYCVEIQVRTLFEEAWGEVDHDVLYPYHKDDKILVEYSRLINRAAGMSDEMSNYFKNALLPTRREKSFAVLDIPLTTTRSKGATSPSSKYTSLGEAHSIGQEEKTVSSLLEDIIHNG